MNIFDDLENFTTLSSPESTPPPEPGPSTALGKRPREHNSNDNDTQHADPSVATLESDSLLSMSQPSSGNVLTFAKSLIARKRFKQSQVDDIERFTQRTLDERLVMIYVSLQEGSGVSGRIHETSTWSPSLALEKNLVSYSRLIVLCPTLPAYGSRVSGNILLSLLRQLRWDIPDDVFSNPASLTKLGARISYHLGQARGALKKELIASIRGDSKQDHMHIYQLAVNALRLTNRKATIDICARLAVLRAVLVGQGNESPKSFWKAVDTRIAALRTKFSNDPRQLGKAMRIILRHDQAEHGTTVTTLAEQIIPESVTENVAHVDQMVADSNDNGTLLVIAATPQPGVTEPTLILPPSEED